MIGKVSFLFFLIAPLLPNAQILKGRVYIANTDQTLAGASIYYSGSSVGTISNEYGDFSLPARSDKLPITVSFVGYSSFVINDYDISKNIVVYLTPLAVQLKDVVVGGGYDGMSRAEKERIFLQEFVGTSKIAERCRVRNLQDIQLIYSRKTKALRAYCSVPIEIENKMLGYHLQYYLESFVRTPRNVTIAGNFIFRESSNIDLKILERRRNAYFGSRMHFIRALWNNQLEKNGFSIHLKVAEPPILNDSLIVAVDSKKYIKVNKKVTIVYVNRKEYLSTFYQVGDQGIRPTNYMLFNRSFVYNSADTIP